jgi:Zn-dependent M28 family amino/carboxypeptidase
MKIRLMPRTRRGWLLCGLAAACIIVAAMFSIRKMTQMPGESFAGALPALTAEQVEVSANLSAHVQMLAGTIGQRNLATPGTLEAAAAYIEEQFRQIGYTPVDQSYEVDGATVRNIVAEIPGVDRPEDILVIGAHYDSAVGTPGADDNASGTAALLELARLMHEENPPCTLRFVAFTNEEPPYFWTENMGSLVYARHCKERGDRIVGALVLEMMGYFSSEDGSQRYPFPFGMLYPKQGNFIAFVGNTKSRAFIHASITSFRRHVEFPSEGIAAPMLVPRIGSSDHWSFWKQGWPALMLTDTAINRNRNYHQTTDTPDTLDYDSSARIVTGLRPVVLDMAAWRE